MTYIIIFKVGSKVDTYKACTGLYVIIVALLLY